MAPTCICRDGGPKCAEQTLACAAQVFYVSACECCVQIIIIIIMIHDTYTCALYMKGRG